MAGALRRDLQAVLGRETHRLGDVIGALDEHDRLRMLVGREVPGHARGVPFGLAGAHH